MTTGEPAVVGIAEHRGWAILVCVSAREGVPVVLDRRRVELVDENLPHQPHHHEAVDLDPAEAEELVGRVAQSIVSNARASLLQLRADLGPQHRLVSIALSEGPARPIPETMAERLESQSALIAADGALYRDALCQAAAELEIDVALHPAGAETERAALALGVDAERGSALLADLGRELGPPWRKDHRSAAAAAIGVLARHAKLDSPS